MIITQTPLRISLLGGGSDFRQFFMRDGGCVLSSAIDKYIYVIIKERFDSKIRIGYTKTELVDSIDQIEHELVRECLRKVGITSQVEISTMGDIPSFGSGLGSSSTVTVGLLNAMYTYIGIQKEYATLAEEACQIEIDILGNPIGIQDQYIAAFGGQRFIEFLPKGVKVHSWGLGRSHLEQLDQRLLLFATNIPRRASTVLNEQVNNIDDKFSSLQQIRDLAREAYEHLQDNDPDTLGALLHQNWMIKKQLASKISNSYIDELYEAARKAGATGGKITGAGGGGYLLLYCPPEFQANVRSALNRLTELSFKLERDGSKVIFHYRR